MKASVIYQALFEKGRAEGRRKGRMEEARRIVLLVGGCRFGEPPSEVVAAVNALTDLQKLEELAVRLLQAGSWQDLPGLNGPGRRGRSRKKTP